jgi:hypothetical protein
VATLSSYGFLTALLPFVLLFVVWGQLTRQQRTKQTATPSEQQQILEKLEEIRAELERLRRRADERDSGGFGFRS